MNNPSITLLIQKIAVPVPSDIENPTVNGITIKLNANNTLMTKSHLFLKLFSGLNSTRLLEESTILLVVIRADFSFDKSCVTSFLKFISVVFCIFLIFYHSLPHSLNAPLALSSDNLVS
jgi:hypothetical protein